MTELTAKQLFDRRIYRKGMSEYYFLHPVTGEQVGPFDQWKGARDALTIAEAPIMEARLALQSSAKLVDVKDVLIRHLGSLLVDEDKYDEIASDLLDTLRPSAEKESLDEAEEVSLAFEDLRVMTVEQLRTTVAQFAGVVPAEHDRQALIELVIDLADWEVGPG